MIGWTPATIHPLASGRVMAFTELMRDGLLVRTGKGVTEASTYVIAKQARTEADALTRLELDKPFLIRIAQMDGKI